MPAVVDHGNGVPGTGTYQLHQGIQRRIAVTIVHENGPELIWQNVRDIMVGRIRNTVHWTEPDTEHSVLALNLLPAHYIKQPHDDRCAQYLRIKVIIRFYY